MPTILPKLVRATNLVSHHLDDRTTELGIGTAEYLVMRLVALNPDAPAREVRRALAMRDPAFSDVVRRTIERGYLRQRPYPRDRRTRLLDLTLPGDRALRIMESIHLDLEAEAGFGQRRSDATERLDQIGHRLAALVPAERYLDGLPLATV